MSRAAASARRSKDKRPEHYCTNDRCLWRCYHANTDSFVPCPTHMLDTPGVFRNYSTYYHRMKGRENA